MMNLLPDHAAASCLVVDDDRGILRVVGEVLEARGQRVILAESIEQARRVVVEGRRFRASIIDLNIREGCGLSLAGELLARQRDLPVLMMSGAFTPELVHAALRQGVRACLPKPLELASLREAIATVLAPSLRGKEANPQRESRSWTTLPKPPGPHS